MTENPRVLIVEDEPDIQDLITYNLNQDGFSTSIVSRGDEALSAAKTTQPDIILLDLMLPGKNGIEICRLLKADPKLQKIPVIMLTARGTETDKVVGLELGADDYMTKPFSPKELTARIRAVLRRSSGAKTADALRSGAIEINLSSHRATLDGAEISLTLTEFNILKELLTEAGRVLNRNELMNRAIGSGVSVTDRTIDVHMAALRKKLGSHGDLIETVRGVGYRLKV